MRNHGKFGAKLLPLKTLVKLFKLLVSFDGKLFCRGKILVKDCLAVAVADLVLVIPGVFNHRDMLMVAD